MKYRMTGLEQLEQRLKERGADYELIRQGEPIRTMEDAKRYFDPEQAAPVLVVQTEQGLMEVIVSASRGRLDWNELKGQLGLSKLKLADRKRAEEETGYRTGAMPLVGLGLPCIFDRRLLELDYLYGGSGDEMVTLKIAPEDVRRLNQTVLYLD